MRMVDYILKTSDKRLKQAIAEEKQKDEWIPCSERLPDETVEVLIYLYRDVPVIAWVESGRWCTQDFDIAKEDEPEAWMPLPKPYIGDWS